MKVLITGGTGFIGSNLALKLEEENNEVTIIDDFSTGNKKNIEGFKGRIIKGDVSEEVPKEKYDAIFHLAAITDPRYGNDEELLRKNIRGFKNIIEKARKEGTKLIYASTAGVYGNGPTPMKEEQEKEIQTKYGLSKLITDEMASHYFQEMHIIGLRYFNVYGPREEHKGRPSSMIYHIITKIMNNEKIKLFKYGEQSRDHIYVKDAVEATIKALEAKKSGIYNVGTGIATSFNELLGIINKTLGTRVEAEYINNPYEGTYQNKTMADTKKAEQMMGFKAKYNLEEGIRDYLKYMREKNII